MDFDLTDEEAAALLRELDGFIDGDRYFLSNAYQDFEGDPRQDRPEPVREPLAPTPKRR